MCHNFCVVTHRSLRTENANMVYVALNTEVIKFLIVKQGYNMHIKRFFVHKKHFSNKFFLMTSQWALLEG